MDVIVKTNARNSNAYSLPFPDISYLNFFTAGAMLRNLAAGDSEATVTGAPVQNAGYIRCTNLTDFIDSGVGEAGAELTLACVSRSVGATVEGTADNAVHIGNYAGSGVGTGGVNIYGVGENKMRASATGTSLILNTLVTPANDWAFYAARVDNTDLLFEDFTNGVTGAVAMSGGDRDLTNARNFRIGSAYIAFPKTCDIAAAAIIHRRVSDEELAELYRRMKAFAAQDGIAI